MKNGMIFFLLSLLIWSCHSSPATTSSVTSISGDLKGINPDTEKETTRLVLNKMILIRGAGEFLYVRDVALITDQTVVINNALQLSVVPAHYTVTVKKDFYKRASNVADMANLTRPPFYTELDLPQLAQRADAAIAYKKGQDIQLDWKLVFRKEENGNYKRVFPNPENESELLTSEAYLKLLDEHIPAKR
jgi:hypothetical protein